MSTDKNAERKEAMLAALADGCTWDDAADRVGVSERTLRRWCEADPELGKLASRAKDSADEMVQAVTFQNCLDPDPANNTLRMFWLKCRKPDVYRDKVEQQHSGGVTIQVCYDDAEPPPPPPPPRAA